MVLDKAILRPTALTIIGSLALGLVGAFVDTKPASAADVTVLVWSDPDFDGATGCNNESTNLQNLVISTEGFALDASITDMFALSTTELQAKLDGAGFFFVPDLESLAPEDLDEVIDSDREDVLRDWVNDGGVFVQTGTSGNTDAQLLNQIFDLSTNQISSVSGSSWARNDNAIGTPYEDGPDSLPNLSATNGFNGAGVDGFTAIYGTESNAVVATLSYGQGTAILLGWDFFAGGPTCTQKDSTWVTSIFPASLNYAAQLSQSGLENPTTSGGTLNYTFSSGGTAYYVVLARETTAPTDSQIKSLATSDPAGGLAAGSASITANTEESFDITGLSAGTDYTAYVVTEYVDDESATVFSAIEEVEFSTVPGIPTVEVTAGNEQVSVAVTSLGANVTYEYSTDSGSNWSPVNISAISSPWAITGLTNGTTYSFLFRAVFSSLTGASSEAISATPSTVPGLPTSLSVSFGLLSGATVSWSAPSSNGGNAISSYTVEYDDGSGWQAVTPSGTAATIGDVWLDQDWSFRVAAVNENGPGSFTSYAHTAAIPTQVTEPTGPPTLVTDDNQESVAVDPGQAQTGTVSSGVVTPTASTVTLVTGETAGDKQTEVGNAIAAFNARWGGGGAHSPQVTSINTDLGAKVFGLLANPETNAPIGVPAEDVVFVTTATEAVMVAAANGEETAKVSPEGALVVAQGSVIAVAAHGLAANTQGELVLLSTPTLLGTFTTDANGTFIGQATLPAGLDPGDHTAVLITPAMVASIGLTMLATPASSITPVPYDGPIDLRFANSLLCSGGSGTLTGQKLDTIRLITVGTQPVEFELLSNGSLSYSLVGIAPGRHQVRISVPSSNLFLTSEIRVAACENTIVESGQGKVNVGSFNGKLVVYALGLDGARITWKVGGIWGQDFAEGDSLNRFDRLTPRTGVNLSVDIFVDGKRRLTKTVLTS